MKEPSPCVDIYHFSAGVGRTGTFMAIDSMLDMSEKEHCVDIFGYVTLMRTCRPSMVQTQDQYIFIHDAILEALTCGVTEVRARDLPNHFKWLLDTDTFTNNIRLDDEFDVSSTVYQVCLIPIIPKFIFRLTQYLLTISNVLMFESSVMM